MLICNQNLVASYLANIFEGEIPIVNKWRQIQQYQ
jgi:hypothetical protein